MEKNPWIHSSSSYVNLGHLRLAKSVAKEDSFYTNSNSNRQLNELIGRLDHVNVNDDSSADLHLQKDCYYSCESLPFFKYLNKLSQQNKALCEVKYQLQLQLIDQESRDICSIHSLDEMIASVEALSSHLQDIINNKQQLIDQLQKTFTGEFLLIDAENQRDFLGVVNNMCSELTKLPTHVENLNWMQSFNVLDNKKVQCLKTLASRNQFLLEYYETCIQLREVTALRTRGRVTNSPTRS